MKNIPKEERERVKRLVGELEAIKLTSVGEGVVSQRVKILQGIFDNLGVEALRDYHKRFEKFLETSQEYFRFMGASGVVKPDYSRREDYTGISGDTKIRLKCYSDHVFFERIYGGSIKISWRFNPKGRLGLVDAMLLPENVVRNLIIFDNYEREPYDWETRRAKSMPLFPEVNLINPKFSAVKHDERYQLIMRFGHSMAYELLENLDSVNIRDSYSLKPGQRQLREIIDNDGAIDILTNASEIMPEVLGKNGEYMTVRYTANSR